MQRRTSSTFSRLLACRSPVPADHHRYTPKAGTTEIGNSMNAKPTPSDWNVDSLSKFLDDAHRNVLVTFVNLRPQYDSLAAIDRLYCKITENLTQSAEIVSGLLLLRSHSSFRGAALACLSGQIAESYMLLRGSLESALYGLYIAGETNRQNIWVRRHENDASLRCMRNEFKISNLLNHLQSADSGTHDIAKSLYDRTIDYGGHPNEHAVSTQINIKSTGSRYDITHDYFNCGDSPHNFAIKSAAQVGICCLDIFYHVFRDRYRILGIDKSLNDIR